MMDSQRCDNNKNATAGSPGEPPVLSVVTPLYNEENIVSELVSRIEKACRSLGVRFEIVAVNDGSRDGTLMKLVELSRSQPELRVINLMRNFGQNPAIGAGLWASRGHAVIVIDGDLQDPPELIPQFFEKWEKGCDVVYGLRTHRRESFLMRAGSGLFYWVMDKFAETRLPRQAGTFSLIDRRLVNIIVSMPERQCFFVGLRAWTGGKTDYVLYERTGRTEGKSRVGYLGLVRLARTALLSFSKVPLRYASMFSLLCGFTMFVVGLSAIGIRLLTNLAIPGWATYTTMMGMMGFVQSLVLAALAEYIAVIFDEVKKRPLFLIGDEFAGGEPVQLPQRTARKCE